MNTKQYKAARPGPFFYAAMDPAVDPARPGIVARPGVLYHFTATKSRPASRASALNAF